MGRFLYIISIGVVVSALAGCQRTSEPRPVSPAATDAGGRMLPPIEVPNRQYDRTIVAAAATVEEAAQPSTPIGGGNVTAVTVDDSTPEGIARTLVEVTAAGSFGQLPDLFVPDQAEVIRTMLGGMGSMLEAFVILQSAWVEKFPDTPLPGAAPDSGIPGMGKQVEVANVETVSDTEARVTIRPTQADASGNTPEEVMTARQVDGVWRLESSDLPDAKDAAEFAEIFQPIADVAPQLIEAANEMAGQIRADAFTTSEEATQAIDARINPIMEPVMQQIGPRLMQFMMAKMQEAGEQPEGSNPEQPAEPDASIDTSGSPPGPSPDTDAQPRPQRDDSLDGTYSGPDQLRRR